MLLVAGSHAATGLYTPAPSFAMSDHTVSTSFFHWYTSTGGQVSGPWFPLEGRPAWTGEPEWWKSQIKQTMMANIDILYVHLYPGADEQRINLFTALNHLRNEGYDVPKVAPFLDPIIIWDVLPGDNDMATTGGKDKFVDQYIRFFNQYYSVNEDAYADDYIAKYDDRVILDSWHAFNTLTNISALTRADVMTRLQAEFGTDSIFSNDIYMVAPADNDPVYSFTDERTVQFEANEYFAPRWFNNMKTAQVKPGYWDQNIRDPGYLLPRDGGIHYTAAWNSVAADPALSRVYIESFNEYDEGSGIYAGDTDNSPWLKPGSKNTGTDTWSTTDDPYEYLKTTATGAAAFNSTPNHDAKILWHDLPDVMEPGSTQTVSVVVRNTGDVSWTAAANYKFGDMADNDAVFGLTRYLIDDQADEIPIYGGIFRGRAKTFQLTLTAPATHGVYDLTWSMLQEGVEWFGEELVHTISVYEEGGIIPARVTFGDLQQAWDGTPKTVSLQTVPAGIEVALTYDGTTNAPVDPGMYTVAGTVTQSGYSGTGTGTLLIEPPAAYNDWKAEWFSPEQQTNPAVSDPHIDFDGDNFNNLQEYIAGTDPASGLSLPKLDLQLSASNEVELSWSPVSGKVYSVEWSPDLTQEFSPVFGNFLQPQSSYIAGIQPGSTRRFYRINISLLTPVTNALFATGEGPAHGIAVDLFQGATVTGHSPIHPAAGGFLAEDMFNHGSELHSADAIFDDTARTFDYVEFHITNAVHLSRVGIGLINDPIEGDDNDNRSVNRIRMYASGTAETLPDNRILDIPIDPEYTTAYGSNAISAVHDQNLSGVRYFRVEFTRSNPASGPRVMEIDGYADTP